MTNMDGEYAGGSRKGGLMWLYMPIVLIVFLGGALSFAAYNFSDTDLSIAESVAGVSAVWPLSSWGSLPPRLALLSGSSARCSGWSRLAARSPSHSSSSPRR